MCWLYTSSHLHFYLLDTCIYIVLGFMLHIYTRCIVIINWFLRRANAFIFFVRRNV